MHVPIIPTVTKSIPSYKIAVGNPARIVKDRREEFYNLVIEQNKSKSESLPNEFSDWLQQKTDSDINDLKNLHYDFTLHNHDKKDFESLLNKIIEENTNEG